jgi:hypothetical protein
MKPRHAAVLALVLLASCGPSIEQSTTRAEAAANRAERSATLAEQSADQSFKASVRALVAADQIEKDAKRADDAVSRLEELPTPVHGDLLVKPTEGSPLRWCLMGPPGVVSSPMGSIGTDWHAPRSRFWVDEIFDSKADCHDELRTSHGLFADIMGKDLDPRSRLLPFRMFCAACSNESEDDDDED